MVSCSSAVYYRSRLAAFLLTINLVVAILLVKVNVGLLSSLGCNLPSAVLDLALIAGFLVILLAGPGKLSLDHARGLEKDAGGRMSARG